MTLKTCVSTALSIWLACLPVGLGQQVPSRGSPPSALKLVILQGQNAKHNATTKSATQTVVEVRDQNNATVPNVRVVFQLPSSGPGGSFPGGKKAFTTITNFQGQAATSGFVPNDALGTFPIEITASLHNRTASATIQQANVTKTDEPAARRSRKTLWILLAAGAAAGAGAAAILATRGAGGAAPGPPPIVVTPGTVTVGGPR